jgi:hypothetical protein
MPVTYITGDPLQTRAQTLLFGYNAKAQSELGVLETALYTAFPAAFATYRKQCRGGRIKPGMLWVWRESLPQLGFLIVRESAVGMTRLRFVESVLMLIARDHRLYGLTSLALAPLGNASEWTSLKPVVDYWLGNCPLTVEVYEGDAGS